MALIQAEEPKGVPFRQAVEQCRKCLEETLVDAGIERDKSAILAEACEENLHSLQILFTCDDFRDKEDSYRATVECDREWVECLGGDTALSALDALEAAIKVLYNVLHPEK